VLGGGPSQRHAIDAAHALGVRTVVCDSNPARADVAVSSEDLVGVVDVARRHDVHPNLLTVWRRQARTGALDAGRAPRQEDEVQFAAVSVAPEQSAWRAHVGTGGTIEIAFASGVRLRITGAVDPATLTAAVTALSGERGR